MKLGPRGNGDPATHQTIPYVAEPEYLAWIADRFAGGPAPTNC